MKQCLPLLAVKDIEKSKKFYKDILGLDVVTDYGANVTLWGGLSLQTLDTWQKFINTENVVFGGNDAEIYFETDDFDRFIKRLKNVALVHKPTEHSWGQKAVRFYDLDRHIIEVGENMSTVTKRFLDSGLSVAETAKRMDIAEKYVIALMKK